MLVCSQCQFHNPDSHKFCQQCGVSLTQKPCAACGTPVAFDLETCPQCGYATATVWWAILTQRLPESDSVPAPLSDDLTTPLSVEPVATPVETEVAETEIPPTPEREATEPAIATAPITYLDPQQRYRLLHPLAPFVLPSLRSELQVQVLDTQPLKISPLEIYKEQLKELGQDNDLSQPAVITTYLEQLGVDLPTSVPAYLALRLQFPFVVPRLHDAWQQEHQEVLLLEDRSSLPELHQGWVETDLAQDWLDWLWELLDLWLAFTPWGCCQSLRVPTNLRLDRGQELCLQRLYGVPELDLSLADLGRIWQDLLDLKPDAVPVEFEPLRQYLATEPEPTSEELQRLLQQVGDQLQAAAVPLDEPVTVGEIGNEEPSAGNIPTVILPNQLLKLEACGQTDTGRDRHHNEDYFVLHQHLTQVTDVHGQAVHAQGIYILCDGMGGHAEGEVASALAATTLMEFLQSHWEDQQLPDEETLATGVYLANQALYQANEQQSRSGSGRMGTTLVVVLIQDLQVRVAHVGDSRLYRCTQRRGLEQMTLDHEVGQREVGRGVEPEIAYARADAFQLTQALGPRDERSLKPEIQSFGVEEDTLLLLCSDGLTDNQCLETYSEQYLLPLLSLEQSLESGIQGLIDLGNQYNGHDNITAVAIRMQVRPQRTAKL